MVQGSRVSVEGFKGRGVHVYCSKVRGFRVLGRRVLLVGFRQSASGIEVLRWRALELQGS